MGTLPFSIRGRALQKNKRTLSESKGGGNHPEKILERTQKGIK